MCLRPAADAIVLRFAAHNFSRDIIYHLCVYTNLTRALCLMQGKREPRPSGLVPRTKTVSSCGPRFNSRRTQF